MVENSKKRRRGIFPSTHIGGETVAKPSRSPQEAWKDRQRELRRAPELERELRRREFIEKGEEEPPKEVNVTMEFILEFRDLVKQAQDARRAARAAKDPAEKEALMKIYQAKKDEIQNDYLCYGMSFEAAYREYLENRANYERYKRLCIEIRDLKRELRKPTFGSVDLAHQDAPAKNVSDAAFARLEQISQYEGIPEVEVTLDSIAEIYGEDSPEYAEALKPKAESTPETSIRSKKEIKARIEELKAEQLELWQDPMVRYFYQWEEFTNLIEAYHRGDRVLETQSVIAVVNKLAEWDEMHGDETTLGGVLVGPPGVGKSTLIAHYLELQGREYETIDLSEEVTRFMLYGSKNLEMKDPIEAVKIFCRELSELSPDEFKKFVAENLARIRETFSTINDAEAVAIFMQVVDEQLAGIDDAAMQQMRGKIEELGKKAFRKELGQRFYEFVHKNGWRDGILVSCARAGKAVILDEFNKCKNWSVIYSLVTARPGQEWSFADNIERITIPDTFKMYFTGNIGRKHGVYEVPEALASRNASQVMEVGYPPQFEELRVFLAGLSNADCKFLRSNEDLAKLLILVSTAFPALRKFMGPEKRQIVPVSYRTIRQICQKLISSRDRKSKRITGAAREVSFDRAIYEVLINSILQFENRDLIKPMIIELLSEGLLLDDPQLRSEIIKYIPEADYDAAAKTYQEKGKKNLSQITDEIRKLQAGDRLSVDWVPSIVEAK